MKMDAQPENDSGCLTCALQSPSLSLLLLTYTQMNLVLTEWKLQPVGCLGAFQWLDIHRQE